MSTLAASALTVFVVLLAGLVAPVPLSRLQIGSTALLMIIFYYAGEMMFASVIPWLVISLQARFDHRLFWPSPADSMAVQEQLRALARVDFARGLGVTAYLVLVGVLLSVTSPLLLPIAFALIVTGYVATLVSIVSSRSAVRKIIRRGVDNNLALLQFRIESFGAVLSELPATALERVRQLIAVHDLIRDSPTSPKRRQALSHAVGSLFIPTITFLAAVFAQEYSGRILDNLLP
ncbi:hypothetical protein [Cryobacterium shii]|uniref:Uncharacterized protein n=1 Tax=Cryobacterium shii TaxID=1259235 RepID=A0AAQ2C587_9MICO|nr:hypothetical protein [Cryobacterium shii]TFC44058.1 hypothetical protein E3O49_12300 [Cryobacterium shii]